jgi:NAD(P)-dependent dehydrogenase (short-subunit alcohol dehydrogenase family)
MRGRRGANIINISSVAAFRVDIMMGLYEASKACVNTLTKVQAKELAPLGIRVNAIAPGPVDTPGLFSGLGGGATGERKREEVSSLVPFGRIGTPGEIARLALFLASPESDFISGSITTIDGAVGY